MEIMLRTGAVGLTERRLTGRVQKHWKSCANGCLPSWADVLDLDLGDDWKHCFVIDLALSDGFPYFVFMGEALCQLSNVYLRGRTRWEETLLDLAAAKMGEAALARAPVSDGDTLRLPDGRRVLYRSVLLPLSENGRDVTHILGAANGTAA